MKNIGADQMNSVVERIAGVNPSKIAAKAEGEEYHGSASGKSGQDLTEGGGVVSAAHAPARNLSPNAITQEQEDRILRLEREVEGLKTAVRKTKPSNRGYNSTVYGRDMRSADKYRSESKNNYYEENELPNNSLIGEMSEFKKLAGIQDSMAPFIGESIQYEDEDVEEDIDVEYMWNEFLAQEGIDPDEFEIFLDNAIQTEDEDDINAALAMEDLFENFMKKLLGKGKDVKPTGMKDVRSASKVAGKGGSVSDMGASGGQKHPTGSPPGKGSGTIDWGRYDTKWKDPAEKSKPEKFVSLAGKGKRTESSDEDDDPSIPVRKFKKAKRKFKG